MTRGNVAIEHDDRDFWHINFYILHDDPGDDGDNPDAFATTRKGATRDEAIALARRKFKPIRITIWDDCPECEGTGAVEEEDGELEQCFDCEDGKVPSDVD